MKLRFNNIFLLLMGMVLATSCVSRKKIAYFQGIENITTESKEVHSIRLKPNDLLSILVSADNLEAAQPFNVLAMARPLFSGGSNLFSSNTTQEVGYLIDSEGDLNFPVLGIIHAEGLTPKELRDTLTEKIKEYIKDPIVNVRVLNFTVSVLGEVQRPGTYTVSGERIAIPEALGLAGDLTIFGRRDNILVVRELDGKKTYKYLDLSRADVLESDFYYLQQHDVIYVEPNSAQRQSSSFNRNSSVYVSMASLLISVLVLIFR